MKDLNEGNPTTNLRFAFATGPKLDSASVSGTLVDAFTGEPVEDATFTLYQSAADSVITTENPTYFAQTDEDGGYTVFNVRPGRYRVVALQRSPSATNYFYDTSGYALPLATGFLDSLIEVPDGELNLAPIRLSTVPKAIRINAVDTTDFGVVKLTFNQPAAEVDVTYSGDYLPVPDKDTLKLFYRDVRPADTLLAGLNGVVADTARWGRGAAGTSGPIRVVKSPARKLNPYEGANFTFNRPLVSYDTARIRLYPDTADLPLPYTLAPLPVYSDSTTLRGQIRERETGVQNRQSPLPLHLRARHNWITGNSYRLVLLPGAVTDFTGRPNADTLRAKMTAATPEDFGTLTLTLTNLEPSTHYILQLTQKGDPVLWTRRVIRDRFEYTVEYPGLDAAEYTVEVLLDSNENGRYDSGDLFFGRQPEAVRRFTIAPLRANWEVEESVDLGGR